MTGPNGVRDRTGASSRRGGADRRRQGAAASPRTGARAAVGSVKRFVFTRKYTLIYLLLLVLLAFAMRSVWYYDAAYTGGPTPLLSGNDPDYHKRTVDYFVENHHFLMRDKLLNYPGGGPNPNPPAYSTSVALIGHALTPFFGGDTDAAVWFSMEIGAALWAALTVIPVYLFTKEMFGRKSAYFAAFFIAVMAGNIERTPLGFSDHDAFFMFFIVTGFYFLLKALRRVKTKVYVQSWRSPRDITVGMQEFGSTNKIALLYAGMAGVSLATVGLSWKGFPYALAIIFVYLLVHFMVNKFRRIDNTAIGLIVLTTVSILMLMALPYYMAMNFMNWYEAPAILFAGVCAMVGIFLFTRDLPWLLIIPVLLLIVAVVLTVVWVLLPDVWVNVFSGAGYFIRTKLYTTIAEAQPPDINRLVFSYGMTTFWLALIGVFILIRNMPKGWKNDQIFATIWALVSMYMAVAAIRFMYNATPVFAILSGWICYDVVRRIDYQRMLRIFRSMKGDLLKALKYSVKLRHVAGALFVVFLIVMPNLWHGVDAGIPYETKKEADLKVYNALPGFLRPSGDLYDPDGNNLWYLGSFGTSFMSDHWAQGMWWLSEQDTWQEEEDRPAFISWWDYGHWCVQVGKHPTAADNFQNGVEFAGNFISAQGEEESMALMAVRLFQLNRKLPEVKDYMRGQLGDEAMDEFLDLFNNPMDYNDLIEKYPERYGIKDDEVSDMNTVFIHGKWLMLKVTTEPQLVDILLWFREQVGDEFRYFAVDSRLMPVSYQNTGIFYAPITLSDNRVDEFIEIVAVHNGNQITLDQAAQLTEEERQNLQYQLVWKRPFYDSMFYHAFVGYSGYDQGPDFTDKGIPFVSGDLARNTPLPAWNMTHYQVVHRTIHWNPYDEQNVSQHTQDWSAISYEDAVRYKEEDRGVIDDAIRTISSGVIYIKYYAGAWINGTVLTEKGEPVPGATITVHDGYRFLGGYMGDDFVGIPHGTTQTDENGSYSILAPFGNVTVVASNGGGLDYVLLHEANVLNQTNLYISDEAAMRQGEYNFTVDMLVPPAYLNGTVFKDLNKDGAYQEGEDEVMANATLHLNGTGELARDYEVRTYSDGYYDLEDMLPGEYKVSVVYEGHTVDDVVIINLQTNDTQTYDVPVTLSSITGKVTRKDGKTVKGTELTVRDLQTNETLTTEAGSSGDYQMEGLLPGNYSVEIGVPGTRPINESVTLEMGEDYELNLTVLPTAFLEGSVFRDLDGDGGVDEGEGLVNATVTFERLYGEELVWTTTTNDTGAFNTSLPSGIYTTYVHEVTGKDHLANLSVLEVDSEEWVYQLDVEVVEAHRVNGTLMRRAGETNDTLIEAGRVPIQLWNEGARLKFLTNSTGVFGFYLPPGSYSMLAEKELYNWPNYNLSFVNVTGSALDLGELNLVNGTRLEGDVYFDMDGDKAVDGGERQMYINVLFDALGHRLNGTTADNGTFYIIAPHANYTVTIDADGFEPFTDHLNATNTNLSLVEKDFSLQPLNVSYSGTVAYDRNGDGNISGDGLPGVSVEFSAEDPENNPNAVSVNLTTGSEGEYALELAPGKYKVKVEFDRDEELGTFRYRIERDLTVQPGTEPKVFNVWLNKLVRVNGTLVLEDGTDDIYDRIDATETSRSLKVEDGEFDDYLPIGERTLTLTYFDYDSEKTFEMEADVVLDRPLTLNLTAYEVVTFSGRVFYDRNHNGVWDRLPENATEEQKENDDETVASINRVVLVGITDKDVYVSPVDGNFTETVYPYDNYTVLVEEIDFTTGAENQWYYNASLVLTENMTDYNIILDRRLQLTGRVYWDRNEDNVSTAGEGIEGAVLHFTSDDGNTTYEVPTNRNGIYDQFVKVNDTDVGNYTVTLSHPAFTPNETEWDFDVEPGAISRDLKMRPINVTLNGTTFLDLNGNGLLNRYEVGVRADHVTMWNVNNASDVHDLSTDGNGSFQVTIVPGSYNLLAWNATEDGHIVHLGLVEVEPSGDAVNITIPLREGLSVAGTMYFINHTGNNLTVPMANLTFTPLDDEGQVPVHEAEGGTFTAVLPEGRYRVNGTYSDTEFGVEMTYELDSDFRLILDDRDDVRLNFTKVREWRLELTWDDIPVFLDQNGSHNFTVYARNVGSENGTFDIASEVPEDWLFESEVDNVTLNMSESTSFWVLINATEDAQAGPADCKVLAYPRKGSDEPSEMDVDITINQFYGFKLKVPEGLVGNVFYDDETGERRAHYDFVVENTGNGEEKVKLNFSTVPGWEFDFSVTEVKLVAYEPQNVPIEVVLPDQAELRSQTLTITGTSLNSPDEEVRTLDFELVLPELRADEERVSGTVGEEPLEWPEESPGFGLVAAIVAVAAVALASLSRRRWSA